jgi:hypothetical protein
MDVSPAGAHRVLRPLNWSRATGNRPLDGDVMKSTAADGSRRLRAQPRGGGSTGVSFFVPTSVATAATAHNSFNKLVHGCAVTVGGTPLPPNLRFVHDGELALPVPNAAGDTEEVNCGEHYTLYTSTESSVAAFEAAYADFIGSCKACELEGGAGALALEVDWDYFPNDRMTLASVFALDALITNTDDANTKMFGTLYTLHLRAKNSPFSEVLSFKPVAHMVAAALDSWTATDPRLAGDALKARKLLSEELEIEFSKFKYEPFWVSD